jgi:potassium efflux system protein
MKKPTTDLKTVSSMVKSALLIICFWALLLPAFCQQPSPDHSTTDTLSPVLMTKLGRLNDEVNDIDILARRGFNTEYIQQELLDLESQLAFVQKHVNSYQQSYHYRSLKSNYIFLEQMKSRLDVLNKQIQTLNKQITQIDKQINAFFSDSQLRDFPLDHSLRAMDSTLYYSISKKWKAIDSINNQNALNITQLQNRLTQTDLMVSNLSEDLKLRMAHFNRYLWQPDQMPLLQKGSAQQSPGFFEVTAASLETANRVLLYYLRLHLVSIAFSILLGLLLAWWVLYISRRYQQYLDEPIYPKKSTQLLYFPLLASLLMTFTIAPFFFRNPPAVVVENLMTLMGGVLTGIFFKYQKTYSSLLISWVLFFVLFRILGLTNLFLYPTHAERWLLVWLNIGFIALAVHVWVTLRQENAALFSSLTFRWAIWLLMGIQAGALISNLAGRFGLAKILTESVTFGVFTALSLAAFVTVTYESLFCQFYQIKRNYSQHYSKDIDQLYVLLRRALQVFAAYFWVSILLKNLNLYDSVAEQISTFFNDSIEIGTATFTLGNIAIFFASIWASVLLCRVVLFMIDIVAGQVSTYAQLSNARLLIKITITTLGIVLAFAASGIPLDRIAITLGALGVGIGFGLQSLVNNLVSGVMLTFEKPIRVGDFVEVGKNYGTVQEIGIRSTRVYTITGSDIMIPNGNLLSENIVNWTLSNNHRRIELHLAIDYDNDLHQVKELIEDVLRNNEFVMKEPAPSVQVSNFINRSIELECFFWSESALTWRTVRTNVLLSLYYALNKENITIRDLNLNINLPAL